MDDELGKSDIRARADLTGVDDGGEGINPQDVDAYWLQVRRR